MTPPRDARRRAGRLLLSAVLALLLLPAPAALAAPLASEGTETVLVAGNPDLYPLEYYDPDTGAFAGVLPELLAEVGRRTGLEFQYLHPGADDCRAPLAANCRVALVSGLLETEGGGWGLAGRTAPLLTLRQGERRLAVSIGWTDLAGGELTARLTGALDAFTGPELAELVLDCTAAPRPAFPQLLATALLSASAALAAVLAAVLLRRRLGRGRRQAAALTDPLTGLGNRAFFEQRFQRLRRDDSRTRYCVLYFSVDMERLRRFHGPAGAEEKLLQVAALLRDHCGADAAAARVGDAHFAVLRRTAGDGELTVWLNTLFSLLHRVDQDPAAGRRSLEIHAGVYELTPADRDASAALFNAEQGCWQAREAGKDYLLAGASLLSASHQLSRDLWESRQALDERQFRLFLQPITDARTGGIYGAEALVRWQHPRRGLLGPDQFIGTMEREGTIQQLDFHMFEEVCRLLASLSREGLGRLLVSCNLSAQTIDTAACFPRLRGILERYDFPRGNLIVEITESVLSRSPEIRLENIRALRRLGLRLALDDFGSGYTSFSDLSLHAYDYVKLDRSLLEDSGDADRQTTLSGLIDFSHRLGLRVLCEGVEKEAQADLLGRLGCDLMQGYYFCRPLPAEEARRFFLREPGKNETLH